MDKEDFRMRPEIKEKWVGALRSGQYKQCRNELHDGEGYCCLGVLVLTCGGKSSLERDTRLRGEDLAEFGISFHTEGLLVSMNDSEGYSFPEIANYIEERL